MPIYEYKCPKGHYFDRFLRLEDYKQPQVCYCGEEAEKQLSAPAVVADYPGYNCPVTGKWIEGRKAHEENLKLHGCRVLETGEHESNLRAKAQADAALEDSIAETAAQAVASMPAAMQSKLAEELSRGEVSVVRS